MSKDENLLFIYFLPSRIFRILYIDSFWYYRLQSHLASRRWIHLLLLLYQREVRKRVPFYPLLMAKIAWKKYLICAFYYQLQLGIVCLNFPRKHSTKILIIICFDIDVSIESFLNIFQKIDRTRSVGFDIFLLLHAIWYWYIY